MVNTHLRATLRANGYTEADLASELGVDAKTVQRWVTQDRTPHQIHRCQGRQAPRRAPGLAMARSTGGREGLMEAQRYPEDFDGYVIGAPVLFLTGLQSRNHLELSNGRNRTRRPKARKKRPDFPGVLR